MLKINSNRYLFNFYSSGRLLHESTISASGRFLMRQFDPLTNDIQGGKIQSGKEGLNGFKRVIWEIPVKVFSNTNAARCTAGI